MAISRNDPIEATEIVDALSNTVGYGTGKKISEFASGTPTTEDKILFEQNGEAKSTTITSMLSTQIYTKVLKLSMAVIANAGDQTTIDYSSFGVTPSNILAWNLTWSNSKEDQPTRLVRYTDDKPYLVSIDHVWSVSQTVTFTLVLLLKK